MRKAIRARLALGALAAAIPAGAVFGQTQAPLPELELGYRFVDVSGNDQMYRSQINDRPGFLLRTLSWDSAGPLDGVFDYAHVDADDLGAGPAGALRFRAGQVDTFRLNFSWRRTNLYSALPAFANPFLDEGIVPGQQTYNRSRDIYDATLEIFPGKKLTPILGFTRNVYRGPGTTTYHVGENEFALDDRVQAVDDEYRIGLAFDVGPVRGAVIQGWRRYRWTDVASLRAGAGNGNIDFPILGQPITADGIDRTTTSRVNTPVTSAWVSGTIFSRVKLVGSYIRADANGDAQSSEIDTGSFVSFQIARFFSGLDDTISAKAKTDYWRGSVRADVNLAPNVDLTAGWTEKSRTLDGLSLVTSLFVDTVTYGGVSVGDLQKLVQYDSAIDRTDRTFDATVTARLFGPFAFNAGWSQTHQDVTFSTQSSEILAAEPGQNFTRTVNTYGAGVSYAKDGFTASADYRRDDGNQPIFRTDFTARDRFKLRGGWKWKDLVRIGGTWQETQAHGDAPEIGYNTRVRELNADLEVGPVAKILTFHASAGEFKVDRGILIRQPQDFDIVPEAQKEMGHTWEGGLRALWKSLTLDGAYLWMKNVGSIPFTINRVRARAEYAFNAHYGAAFEWLRDQYGEKPAFDQAGSLADYNANRYGVFLHWTP
ncbi:MAG TPA: hypothetical protein VIA45_10830 [Thermoanaerobaculia bacterium]|jgi:hypothetical protein